MGRQQWLLWLAALDIRVGTSPPGRRSLQTTFQINLHLCVFPWATPAWRGLNAGTKIIPAFVPKFPPHFGLIFSPDFGYTSYPHVSYHSYLHCSYHSYPHFSSSPNFPSKKWHFLSPSPFPPAMSRNHQALSTILESWLLCKLKAFLTCYSWGSRGDPGQGPLFNL